MNAYVDVGAFKGSYIRHFRKNPRYNCGTGYTVFAFECNPALAHVDYGQGVTTIKKAAWVNDGELKFYMNTRHPTIEGHSVYKDKITGSLDKEHPVRVPCIDFSKWLNDTFGLGDSVIVKMNIEGAEYDVLEKCINDSTISLISELHIQWHQHKIPNISRARHELLVNKLQQVKSLKMYSGYGQLRVK